MIGLDIIVIAYNVAAKLYFKEFAQINVLNKGGRGVVSPLDRVSL